MIIIFFLHEQFGVNDGAVWHDVLEDRAGLFEPDILGKFFFPKGSSFVFERASLTSFGQLLNY